MAIIIKYGNPHETVILILVILLIFIRPPENLSGQSRPLTQDDFNLELSNAYIQNDEHLADSLIRNHRLYIKPFVNDIITRSIVAQLQLKTGESANLTVLAEKVATSFEKIFDERSLENGVSYLKVWSLEQKEKKLTADSLYTLGLKLRTNKQDRERVLVCYQKALDLYTEIGDEWGEAEVLGGLGLYYWNTDYNKSLAFYLQALAKRVNIDDKQLVGNSLNSIGSLYYSFIKDYDQALSYLNRAEAVRIEIGDSMNLGRTVHVQASVYERKGQLDKSLEYYNRSFEINQKYGDQLRMAQAKVNSGGILNSIGKYPEALENLETALEINKNLNDSLEMGVVLSQIGFVYSNLGDYNTAVGKINQASEIFQKLNEMWELAGVYNHLGIVLQNAGRVEKAREYYNKALEIYIAQEDRANEIGVLSNIGTLLNDLKDYTGAEEFHNKSLQVSREIKDRDQEVRCLLNLANDQTMLGKLDEARSNYDAGYRIAKALNNPDLLWRIIGGMAENCKHRGDFKTAVALNDSALSILEELRITLPGEDWRTSYMAREHFAFEDVIGMLANLHEKDGNKGYDLLAFRYAEQSKSRALLDLLTESLAGVNEAADSGLIRKRDEILADLNAAKQKLQEESLSERPDKQAIQQLKDTIKISEDDLETIKREIRISNPRYADLQYPQPVSLEEVQALCHDKNTVLLEYSLGDSSSCLWVITGKDHKLYKLPGRRTLQEQTESFRFALLDPKSDNHAFLADAGYLLYEKLIKPAEPSLSKKSKLVIIPDGILNYLPFEALLTDNQGTSPEGSYSGLPYLLKKYPVSYVQSASVLKNLLSTQANSFEPGSVNPSLIAFGDPVYELIDEHACYRQTT